MVGKSRPPAGRSQVGGHRGETQSSTGEVSAGDVSRGRLKQDKQDVHGLMS